MSTTILDDFKELDGPVLLRTRDLLDRRIVPTKKTLREWMRREHDPFPQPLVLSEGKLQPGTNNRYSGRHIAWLLSDVEAWLSRRRSTT
jgi:hypothetical protein